MTNFQINKASEKFKDRLSEEEDEKTCIKWSVLKWKSYMAKNGVDVTSIFQKINDVIVKTVISFEAHLMSKVYQTFSSRNNFYELFGFDILIDRKYKPWLLEVNVCPSLNCSTPLDRRIKTSMICDL